MWEIKNTELDIHIYGQTFEEVVQNTIEELMFLYDEYAMEEDENLTRDAIDLKRTLLGIADEL